MPVLSITLPPWQTNWLPDWSQQSSTDSLPAPHPIPASADHVSRPSVQPSRDPGGDLSAEISPARDSLPQTTAARPAEVTLESIPTPWSAWLIPAWLFGMVLALLPIALGLGQLALLRQRSFPVTDANLLSLMNTLRSELRLRRRVTLRQSKDYNAGDLGLCSRSCLFPPRQTGGRAQRRLVLLHELAHIRRWDWLTQMLAHLACALYWCNPLVWVAARQMRIERERACDDLVLASGRQGVRLR